LKAAHYITLASALVLMALLYKWGNTTPPAKMPKADKQARPGAMAQGSNPIKPASFDSLLASSKMQLVGSAADSVKNLENQLTAIRDQSRMAVIFSTLGGVWDRSKQPAIGTYYNAKAAKLENSGKKLTFAGQLFLQLMQDEHSASVQMWEATEAVSCLEQSLKIDSTNEDTKLALASAYIEGTGEPMRGVMLLRGITEKNPDDVSANMLLGRMSIQSGQYDKAVKRFETVLNKEPGNSEAVYFLAQSYEGLGNKAKAIELLKKCKELVNKPDFSREIDQHINSLK
jgi:tetratricopeptide (TPR) repeat protein